MAQTTTFEDLREEMRKQHETQERRRINDLFLLWLLLATYLYLGNIYTMGLLCIIMAAKYIRYAKNKKGASSY